MSVELQRGPEKWVECRSCKTEFKVAGFRMKLMWAIPAHKDGQWIYPTVCKCCAAKGAPVPRAAMEKPEPKKQIRMQYKDDE